MRRQASLDCGNLDDVTGSTSSHRLKKSASVESVLDVCDATQVRREEEAEEVRIYDNIMKTVYTFSSHLIVVVVAAAG